MSDSYTTLNAATVAGGDKVDMEAVTVAGIPVKRTRTVICGTADVAIAAVTNSPPSASAYGLPVRQAGPPYDYSGYKWKLINTGTTQTGTALWTPASGKKILVTDLLVITSLTSASDVTLWFGSGGDTTYTEGTDQLLFYVVGNGADNRIFMTFPHPIPSLNADYILRITTTNNLPTYVKVGGYEF